MIGMNILFQINHYQMIGMEYLVSDESLSNDRNQHHISDESLSLSVDI